MSSLILRFEDNRYLETVFLGGFSPSPSCNRLSLPLRFFFLVRLFFFGFDYKIKKIKGPFSVRKYLNFLRMSITLTISILFHFLFRDLTLFEGFYYKLNTIEIKVLLLVGHVLIFCMIVSNGFQIVLGACWFSFLAKFCCSDLGKSMV